jgi:hypothetical protein
MTHPAGEILDRDLQKLEEEIFGYPTAEAIWKTAGKISNSGGNLCLHICGNLQHFIGAVLGSSGYQRNREAEFAVKNISRDALLEEIRTTRTIVGKTLNSLSDEILKVEFPHKVSGRSYTTEFFLIHLAAHLNYHLGQINYHRRLVGSGAG